MAFEISIPRLGWSMEEGIFAGWRKQPGEFIRRGDILFELEGEKALQEIEALDEGILTLDGDGPQSGAVLKVGAIVGYLLAPGESITKQPNTAGHGENIVEPPGDTPAASPSIRRMARQLDINLNAINGTGPRGRITEEDVTTAAQLKVAPARPSGDPQSVVATPRARRAAVRGNVDLSSISGTGRNGRIRERDVLLAAESPTRSPASSGQRIEITGRRKIIAERLSRSARETVPVTVTTRADATNLVALREQFKATGVKPVPAIHDIVARLTADALIANPMLSGRWENDGIVLPARDGIHIGLAVDTPEGLIVPVLRNVGMQSLPALAIESERIIRKARDGRLGSTEMQGSVFTISNLGGFGIDAFTPVINLPETAILGLGAIRREPVVSDDGRVEVRQIMTLSLTFDHRVIDGAPAARFLQTLVHSIANPAAKLLSSGG